MNNFANNMAISGDESVVLKSTVTDLFYTENSKHKLARIRTQVRARLAVKEEWFDDDGEAYPEYAMHVARNSEFTCYIVDVHRHITGDTGMHWVTQGRVFRKLEKAQAYATKLAERMQA